MYRYEEADFSQLYSGLLFIDFNIPFHNCINLVTYHDIV